MTPIKMIVWCGATVAVIDHAGLVKPLCMTANEQEAEWVAWSIATAHHVPHAKVESLPQARVED